MISKKACLVAAVIFVVVVCLTMAPASTPEIKTTDFTMKFGPGSKPIPENTGPLILCTEGSLSGDCDLNG